MVFNVLSSSLTLTMPLILTNDNYVLLDSPSESNDNCEIKSTTGSPIHQSTINKSSSSSSRSMPTISSPFIQGWLRRQLMPVIIRSKVNDSKSSWKGSVDLPSQTLKTHANEYTNMSKLSATINSNNSTACAINNFTNNLNNDRCLTPNYHLSPVKNKFIDNNLELQSQSAPCTPKFMMKRPPVETIYSTPLMDIETLKPNKLNEIDYLSRELTEKDRVLTELRLELLSTEDQIEELRELIGKLGKQLVNLREENKRLNNLVDSLTTLSCYKLSRASGQSSTNTKNQIEQSTIESTF